MRIGWVVAIWMPGDQVAQHRPRGEAGHQAGDAGRGKQADAVLADRLEGHQGRAHGEQHDQRVDDMAQDAHLRDVLAGDQNVDAFALGAHQVEIARQVAPR